MKFVIIFHFKRWPNREIRTKKKDVFLDEQLLQDCKLEQPWLVKIHQKLHLPLYADQTDLFHQQASELKGGEPK